jgi:cytochrome c oxidase subunit 4
MIEPITRDERNPSSALYIIVWIALVVLATITLLVTGAPIGNWSIVIAIVIAITKAALVVMYFMHLKHGRPLHRMVFLIAIGFLVLVVIGLLADVGTRSLASAYAEGSSPDP